MTTGTLGCQTNQSVQSMAMYMDSNIDKVARDMSRGSGENLDTLAVLLGVDEADRDSFRKVLQDNFATIFPSSDTTSGEGCRCHRSPAGAERYAEQVRSRLIFGREEKGVCAPWTAQRISHHPPVA